MAYDKEYAHVILLTLHIKHYRSLLLNRISSGYVLKELAVTLADVTKTSLTWEFHLLLLCLCNVFFFVVFSFFHSGNPQVPPTHTAFLSPLTLSVLLPLPSPLPNKRTYTYALKKKEKRNMVLTDHLRQICWSLCTRIKLMTSCVRPQWTKWSCYRCSSLQYPAPKPDERSMIYQSVSVVLARGWNTKHTEGRWELHLWVWSDAAAWI